MNTRSLCLLTLALLAVTDRLHAQGTAFTYQGRLNSGGAPANGSFDLAFTLFSTKIAGTAIAGPLTNTATAVSNGLFTTAIDFGAGVFTGGSNWLEIAVSTNGANRFVTLAPRQQLMAVPYALWAGTASNLSGTVSAAQLTGTIPPTQLPATVVTNGGSGVTLTGNFSGNGAGLTNVSSPGMAWQTVTGTVQAQSNQGYIATDTAMVTITLPASPNVGDIIRVSGAGAGGWTITQNAGQVILGANFSAVAPNAQGHLSGSTWTCVASSADFTTLVAGALEATEIPFWVSSNSGATWTRPSATVGAWASVASSADGTKLVAVAATTGSGQFTTPGAIFTSPDSGVTWTKQMELLNSGVPVASSADGVKLVCANNGNGVLTSADSGTNWGMRTPGSLQSSNWSAVACSADFTTLVATINGGPIYTSTNSGTTWKARASNQAWDAVAASADGTKLVAAVHHGQIWTSSDSGVTWTPYATLDNWMAVASSADGTKLAAGVASGPIYMSSDSGVTWTPRMGPQFTIYGAGGLAMSADGTKLVAADNGTLIYTYSDNTTSGTAGYLVGGLDAAVELQYIGNNQFRPLSFTGGVYCY